MRLYTIYTLIYAISNNYNIIMSIRDIAVKYIKSLQPSERIALKNMVERGIICCHSYAERNGITAQMITNELKAIFEE